MDHFSKVTQHTKFEPWDSLTLHDHCSKIGCPFINNECKDPVIDLDELRRRMTKFILLEELKDLCNKVQDKIEHPRQQHGVWIKEPKTSHFAYYTLLNTTRIHILEETLNPNLIPILRKVLTPQKSIQYNSINITKLSTFDKKNVLCWRIKSINW